MKKAIFTKPFNAESPKENYLKSLLQQDGFDKEKIQKEINCTRKGLKGEGDLSYYLANTYAEILCLHNVKIM